MKNIQAALPIGLLIGAASTALFLCAYSAVFDWGVALGIRSVPPAESIKAPLI